MTLRQQEFCRRYAAGMPAAKAALAAGYAQSTAETNAARLLDHPLCATYIASLREHMALVTADSLRAVAQHLITIAQTPTDDPRAAIAAAEQLRHLAVISPRLALVPLPDKTPTNTPQSPDKKPTIDRQIPDINTAQSPQNQPDTPPDIDTLPDGSPAFDIRILPTRPAPPKPKPVEIRVISHIPKPQTLPPKP